MQDAGKLLLERADELNLSGQLAEAEKLYDEFLTQNHDQPWLLATIGCLYLRMNKYGMAIALLSIAAKELRASEVLCNLGLAYKYSGQHDKALYWMEKACEKDRDPNAITITTYAGLHINVGTPEIALKHADNAISKDPSYEMAHWNKSIALLELGRWETAWDEMEHGFDAKMRVRRNIADAPYWDGTKGKTIAVYGEQGIGDEIMFASMLPDLMRDNHVIFESHRRLKTLFKKAWPGLEVFGTREDKELVWPEMRQIDYAVSVGSLGKWFRRSRDAFPGTPYLTADALPRGDKFRVGISWTGGAKQGRVRTRSVPLAWWKSILNVRDVEFVSLQYTDADAEIDAVNATGYDIQKSEEAKELDYYETARLVKSCDLVISVCTSVIHLAGALGVPCWVMVPNKPAWRYGVTGGMPWYRSVRLYRQPKGSSDTWMPVIQRVGYDLDEMMNGQQRKEIAA